MAKVESAQKDIWLEPCENGSVINYRYRSWRRSRIAFVPIILLVSFFPIGILLLLMAWSTRHEAGADGMFEFFLVTSIVLTSILVLIIFWVRKVHVGEVTVSVNGVEVGNKIYPLDDISATGWRTHGNSRLHNSEVYVQFGDREVSIMTGLHSDVAVRAADILNGEIEGVNA